MGFERAFRHRAYRKIRAKRELLAGLEMVEVLNRVRLSRKKRCAQSAAAFGAAVYRRCPVANRDARSSR